MNKKLAILLVAIACFLICAAPIASAEGSFLDSLNPFADSTPDLDITGMQIQKVKKVHTDSEGNTKKSTDVYLKFKVKTDSDSMGNYTVEVKCLDKDNKEIKTIKSYVDSEGNASIPLKDVSGIKSANLTISDDSGNVLYNNSTSNVKTIEKVTKDKPKTTSSSSSSSSATYWASANSNKFHYPSCEWAQKISSKNKIVFHSRSEALNAGYSPCQVCGP